MASSALFGHVGLEIQPEIQPARLSFRRLGTPPPVSTSGRGVAVAAAGAACAALPAPLQLLERGGGSLLRLCPQLALRNQLEPRALQPLRLG